LTLQLSRYPFFRLLVNLSSVDVATFKARLRAKGKTLLALLPCNA